MDNTSWCGRITVFSITGCPHCMSAKNSLKELQYPFVEINLDEYPSRREWVQTKTGKTSVPQIFFNSIHIGGNSELQDLIKDENRLEEIVNEVINNTASEDSPTLPNEIEVSGQDIAFTCNPDEMAELVKKLKNSSIISNNWCGIFYYKKTFNGNDFLKWVCKERNIDEKDGLELGQTLLNQHFYKSIKKSDCFEVNGIYRLLEDFNSDALNSGETSQCTPSSVSEIGESLRQLILKLYSTYLSNNGQSVDYAGIAKDPDYENYKKMTLQLVRLDLKNSSRQEKLSFFINIYNALVIHANIERGPPNGTWQRYRYFNGVKYIIGGMEYSLQDIENGILRANQKGVGQFSPPFKSNDPRREISLEKPEPLIHFALVCGAKSCPPIKTYTAKNIDKELRMSGQSFLESDDGCQVSKKQVKLSMILKWYSVDFGKNDSEILGFVHDHLGDSTKKKELKELINNGSASISFMPYDWSINS